MNRQLAAKMHRFSVADHRNSGLLPAISALNRHIFINNLFGPDLFRGSLNSTNSDTNATTCRLAAEF